ncbi:MAG: M48 family metalloprotease [Eubacteriales bacterium]
MKKTVISMILSYVSTVIFFVPGLVAAQCGIPKDAPGIGMAVGITVVLILLPVLLWGINLLLSKHFVKELNQKKVAEMNNYLVKHREEAEKTASDLQRKLRLIRHLTDGYGVLLWLLAGGIAFFGGTLFFSYCPLFWLLRICSWFVFLAAYGRIRRSPKVPEEYADPRFSEAEYPKIYSLARRAAEHFRCNGDIRIRFFTGCNAGIARNKRGYWLNVGIDLLCLMSEDELYHIFIHEFSHVSQENTASSREMTYQYWVTNHYQENSKLQDILSGLFFFSDCRYLFYYFIYSYATSLMIESQADRAMAEFGNAKVAASALLKLKYNEMYLWENRDGYDPSAYASEVPNPHFLRTNIQAIQDAIGERSDFWNELAKKEILPNNSSHPTLKMRLETLGVNEISLTEDQSSEEYRSECQKALDCLDEMLCNSKKEVHAQERDRYYLKPLERINKWMDEGMPISAENYADLICDLRDLGRNREAEELCDRVLAELNENSSVYASFMKGCFLLHRYDESGMAYLYRAVETNANFLEEGLDTIGKFCCYTGREKELLEYRERAARLAQKNKDEDSKINRLEKSDHLTEENLPDGMLENILSFILSIDEGLIQNIYLVRKTVSDSFFASAFVIRFNGGTDDRRDEIMHRIFCYLDSYPVDWQFSLFTYEELNFKVEKIKGSLVYTKKDAVEQEIHQK